MEGRNLEAVVPLPFDGEDNVSVDYVLTDKAKEVIDA